jgi:hypothetical protein
VFHELPAATVDIGVRPALWMDASQYGKACLRLPGSFPFKLTYILHVSLCVPIKLTADSADYFHISSPKSNPGEEASDVLHPVVRVVWIDEIDLYESFLQVFIHTVELTPSGQPWHKLIGCPVACHHKFVTEYHHCLCQIQ